MKHEPRTTLVVTAGELHDLIEAVQSADYANCQSANRLMRRGAKDDAEKIRGFSGRLRPLLRRLQETEAILAARKSEYPEAFYTWLEPKYLLTRYQLAVLAVLDDEMKDDLFKEWETDYGEEPG